MLLTCGLPNEKMASLNIARSFVAHRRQLYGSSSQLLHLSLSGAAAAAPVVPSNRGLAAKVVKSPSRHRLQVRAMSQAAAEKTSSKDIIERIKTDHSELDNYYGKYKAAVKGGDKEEALKWFNQFVWEVSRHSVSEELVMYPLLETLGERGKQLADKSRSDHHKVKELLAEMESISDPFEFEPKMDEMMKDLREHIKMEESEDLVLLKEKLDLGQRETAGSTFALGKNIAPTHPHTMVPEKPVLVEAALGLLATPLDKVRDLFTSFPDQKSMN